jgi:hypothetical protein
MSLNVIKCHGGFGVKGFVVAVLLYNVIVGIKKCACHGVGDGKNGEVGKIEY